MKKVLLILLFSFWKFSYNPKIKADYFDPPVKIPLYLAGNFGELRTNHFHSGIDIKTQGRTGIPVYAAAEGEASRISVSPVGFGLALYINHPEGYTTVYAHLERLRDDLRDYLRTLQYEQQTFALDVAVPPGKFKFEKGELIAYSGNSGGSGGPHLHFEIRDTDSEHPINPLLFNFRIADNQPPKLYSVLVSPLSDDATVAGKRSAQRYETVLANGTYQLKDNPAVTAAGEIGLGIQTLDFIDGTTAKCGVYQIDLSVNDELVYRFKMNELNFDENRYINSHIDYSYLYNYGRRYHKNWVEEGNNLNNYTSLEDRGRISIEEGETYNIGYVITDANGNTSRLNFTLTGTKPATPASPAKGIAIEWNSDCEIEKNGLVVRFESETFYSDFVLDYGEKPGDATCYSPIFRLHRPEVPVHRFYALRLKAVNLPAKLQPKALIVTIDPKTGKRSAIGGSYRNGWVEAQVRQLGSFTIATDTKAPTIAALNIQNHNTLTNKNKISFKINDDLSGIASFRGEIDGQWVLFEYDPKNELLEYRFDPRRLKMNQTHQLKLTITDAVGNANSYEAKFFK